MTARRGASSRSATLEEDLESARGRWLGYMFGFAAVLSPISLVVPHEGGYDTAGIVAVAIVAAATAIALLLIRRPSDAVVHASVVLAALLTTASVHFTNGLPNAATLFYVWIVLFVFYFFDWRIAVVHLLIVLGLYALSAIETDTGSPIVGNVIATVGALGGAGAIVAALRRRVGALTTALVETALTDELTGLPNRRAFTDHYERALARVARNSGGLAIAMADLDHFKRVNDRYGHATGDEVLSRFGALLAASVRAGDVAARLGGEEFGVLFIEGDVTAAAQVAERIRAETERAFAADGPPVTTSIGVAFRTPDDPVEKDELMRRADQALYAAKDAGRNRVVVWAEAAPAATADAATAS